MSSMGRPREHNLQTAAALLDAAERTLQRAGPEALSVRRVADEAGTTTRAVYSLFGSKEGLVVALGARAFGMLGSGVQALPRTSKPTGDLVEAALSVFRPFALGHPSLFRLAFQLQGAPSDVARRFAPSAGEALQHLRGLVARVVGAERDSREVQEATLEFHALCEGLAALELRCILPRGGEDRIWRQGITALVTGLAGERAYPAASNS